MKSYMALVTVGRVMVVNVSVMASVSVLPERSETLLAGNVNVLSGAYFRPFVFEEYRLTRYGGCQALAVESGCCAVGGLHFLIERRHDFAVG